MAQRSDRHTSTRRGEHLSAVPDARPDPPPTYIAESWNRSRDAGLAVDRGVTELSYVQDLDLQRRLVHCATPVLDRLHSEMSNVPLAVALTDQKARVLLRRDTERSLADHLDRACFAPGFDYSETRVGTNGVGTAIETRMPIYVDGSHHFNVALHKFTCAGAPIHDPVSGKLEGILDVSCLATEANPMMRQLAVTAARDIEAALLSSGSAKQQAVLNAFVLACRRRQTRAVFSLSCGVFMSNSGGSRLLDPVDEVFLREEAQCMLAPGRTDQFTLMLPSGQWASVRRTLVQDGGEPAGIVLEVDLTAATPPPRSTRHRAPTFPGAVGYSPQWERCRTELSQLASTSTNVLLIGEDGTGRVTLARGAHLHTNPQARCTVVDCSSPDVVEDVRAALATEASSVVLRRVDALSPRDDEEITEAVAEDQHRYPARWVVATSRSVDTGEDDDPLSGSTLVQLLERTVAVPALRHHPDDIPDIARLHAAQLAQREVEFSDGMLRALTRYSWPGNVTELVATLKYALRTTPAGILCENDLPPSLNSAPKHAMNSLEIAERDEIVRVLREYCGNRVRTAKALGISRSSLYRKLEAYGIQV